jgi:hypothetical protein
MTKSIKNAEKVYLYFYGVIIFLFFFCRKRFARIGKIQKQKTKKKKKIINIPSKPLRIT